VLEASNFRHFLSASNGQNYLVSAGHVHLPVVRKATSPAEQVRPELAAAIETTAARMTEPPIKVGGAVASPNASQTSLRN
jgi:hypothetical protein